MAATVRLVGRDEVGDVADDENIAWIGIEDGCRISPAVTAGDDQGTRRLAFYQVLPSALLGLVAIIAETPIPLDEIAKATHVRLPSFEGEGWQGSASIAIWPA